MLVLGLGSPRSGLELRGPLGSPARGRGQDGGSGQLGSFLARSLRSDPPQAGLRSQCSPEASAQDRTLWSGSECSPPGSPRAAAPIPPVGTWLALLGTSVWGTPGGWPLTPPCIWGPLPWVCIQLSHFLVLICLMYLAVYFINYARKIGTQ